MRYSNSRLRGLLSAAAVLAIGNLAAAQEGAWRPVPQPDLVKAFEAAPALNLESVCAGPDACWVGPQWWIANPDGRSYDVVLFYYPAYMGPHQVVIFDFGTGRMKQMRIGREGEVEHMFHLSPTWLIKGKLLCRTQNSGAPAYWVYDPATNELKLGGIIGDGELTTSGGWAVAVDGTINGVGRLKGSGDLICYRIDPDTWKYRRLTEQPVPVQKNFAGIYATYATQGEWMYAALGNTPWRLYAFNTDTGVGKVIAESDRIVGNYKTMRLHSSAKYDAVRLTTDKGLGETGGPGEYWLVDGKVFKGTAEGGPGAGVRPRPASTVEARSLGNGAHSPPAGYETHRMMPDTDTTARYWYKLSGKALAAASAWASPEVKAGKWGRFEFPVTYYPAAVSRLVATSDNRIVALTEGYGRAVMYNPITDTRELLGQTMSVYSMETVGGQVYMAGYPGGKVWVYDPTQPWTVGRIDADAVPTAEASVDDGAAPADLDSNPREVAKLMEFTNMQIPLAGVAAVGDRVYFAGRIIRIGNGGGFGWWDTATGKADGMYLPLLNDQVFWMCSAGDDRHVVLSTKPVPSPDKPAPERGRLFVFDTQAETFVHKIDSDAWRVPGYVAEAGPGLVIGYGSSGGASPGVLYGFDVKTGAVLWTKPIPNRPTTAFSQIRRGRYFFRKGPDGWIWATMGGALCRINPADAEVRVIGKLEDTDLAFSGGRVYVAGARDLRRIAGLQIPERQ